jgi:ribonuclease HI
MESEAIALLEALKQAVKENHTKLHIQGDSKNVVSMTLGSAKPPKQLKPIFTEIWGYLEYLEDFKINWVPRGLNKADVHSRIPSS